MLNNNDRVLVPENINEASTTIRSPTAKFYNAQAMLLEKNLSPVNNVINTGIIGINKDHLNRLNYFKNFDDEITMMNNLR